MNRDPPAPALDAYNFNFGTNFSTPGPAGYTLTVCDTGVNCGYDNWTAPEPASLLLMAGALCAVECLRRRRRSI